MGFQIISDIFIHSLPQKQFIGKTMRRNELIFDPNAEK